MNERTVAKAFREINAPYLGLRKKVYGPQGNLVATIATERRIILGSKGVLLPYLIVVQGDIALNNNYIPIAPYMGKAVTYPMPGQRSATFKAEGELLEEVKNQGENLFTGRRGLPISVPDIEVNHADEYMAQDIVPFGMELAAVIETVLRSPFHEVMDEVFQGDPRAFSLFQKSLMLTFVANALTALEDVHNTIIGRTGEDSDNVLVHGDLDSHLLNVLYCGIPGSQFGKTKIIDFGTAHKTTINRRSIASNQDVYRQNNALREERNKFMRKITSLLDYAQLDIGISNSDNLTSQSIAQMAQQMFNELSTMGIARSLVERNFLRLYIADHIIPVQKRLHAYQFTSGDIDVIAQGIQDLFKEQGF